MTKLKNRGSFEVEFSPRKASIAAVDVWLVTGVSMHHYFIFFLVACILLLGLSLGVPVAMIYVGKCGYVRLFHGAMYRKRCRKYQAPSNMCACHIKSSQECSNVKNAVNM